MIKLKIYKLFYSRLLLFTLFSVTYALPVFSDNKNSLPSDFVGSWKLYKDDDSANGYVPNEVMSFWPNGKFKIYGDSNHKGLYRVSGNNLEMLVKIGDRALAISRQFQFQKNEFKFQNKNIGWVYYKRISDKPDDLEPDL